jgi:hypothetical protein
VDEGAATAGDSRATRDAKCAARDAVDVTRNADALVFTNILRPDFTNILFGRPTKPRIIQVLSDGRCVTIRRAHAGNMSDGGLQHASSTHDSTVRMELRANDGLAGT